MLPIMRTLWYEERRRRVEQEYTQTADDGTLVGLLRNRLP
jgi:hypothetical protein